MYQQQQQKTTVLVAKSVQLLLMALQHTMQRKTRSTASIMQLLIRTKGAGHYTRGAGSQQMLAQPPLGLLLLLLQSCRTFNSSSSSSKLTRTGTQLLLTS
jgi:hypothetical protein